MFIGAASIVEAEQNLAANGGRHYGLPRHSIVLRGLGADKDFRKPYY